MNAMTEMVNYRHEKVLFVNNEKAGLKAIIAVHNTNLIGGSKSPLHTQAAAGIDKTGTALGHFHGKARGDKYRFSGLDGNRRIQTSVQICASGITRAIGRQNCIRSDFLYCNGTHVCFPLSSQRITFFACSDAGTSINR